MEYIDPQKARQERERLERERQAKIQAEKDRKARLKAEEERKAKVERDRKARLKAEEERKAKLEAEQKDPHRKANPQPKTKQSKDKKPDDKNETITPSKAGQTNPIYGSSSLTYSSPIHSQGSVPIANGSQPKTKPKAPRNRPPRTWSGETAEEPKAEAKSEHKPYQPRDFSSAKARIAEGRALKEQKQQEQQSAISESLNPQPTQDPPSFLTGSFSLSTALTNPFIGASLLSGAQALGQPETLQRPEPRQVARGQGARLQTPEQKLEHKFQTNVASKAQGLLKANKDRLNGEQTAYLQDNNPKGDRWSHLWQVAAQRREFQAQHANLKQQIELTTAEMNELSAQADMTGLMSTPQERQNSAKNKKLMALSEQKQRLEGRIEVAKQMQVSLEYAYPALAAVKGETGANAEDIKKVQGRLPKEFDGIRGNIDKLSGEITKDPSTALLFDSVVTDALLKGGHNQRQRQGLTAWLEGERSDKERLSQLGQVLGGGLFLGSFVPQLRGLSPLLKFVGAGTLGATFAYDLPDLLLLDAAAQSGRGGAGKLTSQSPDEARFNLVMGYANVALAGLDVGAQVGVIQNLKRVMGQVSSLGAQVSRQTWAQVMSLANQGEVGMAKARALLAKGKGMSDGVMDEVMDVLSPMEEVVGVGKLSRQEMRGQTAGQATEEALKKAKVKKPPKAFEAYANAGSVKPFIGTKVDPNNLPQGYLYGKMPLKDGTFREVIYLPESNGDLVPLKLDAKGFIKQAPEGEYRIVNKTAYDKNVETTPGQAGKLLGGKSQVHHLYADNLLRGTPFGQRALKLGAFNPDAGPNLIELANSLDNLNAARKANPNVKFSDFVHNTQHKEFDKLMQTVVDDVINEVREAKGLSRMKKEDFIQQMTKEEIETVMTRSTKRMRRGLMNEDTELHQKIKTRPNSGSLAQGESPDNSEVA